MNRGHNLDLPRHLFVRVASSQVLKSGHTGGTIEGVWFGLSVEAGRGIGCHVLLENGALVADLPLGALSYPVPGGVVTGRLRTPQECEVWDGHGDVGEVRTFEYLDGLEVGGHLPGGIPFTRGRYLFTLDYLGDGYSRYGPQHKLYHCIADSSGALYLLPNDRLLWADAAVNPDVNAWPSIKRQNGVGSIELAPPVAKTVNADEESPDKESPSEDSEVE
jgi:hypothetical protein